MLHTETVLPGTLDLLRELQALAPLADMRLVGGTALALQLGHRTSVDIDLFGRFDGGKSMRQLLVAAGHVAEGSEDGDIQSLVVDGVMVDFVNYPYPWIADPVCEDGVRLAGLEDIVAMKLSAAANRGKKKDFLDLAVLLERFQLMEMFSLYQRKFSVSEIAFALRGLTYFDDAEDDPMPRMFTRLTWPEAKTRLLDAVRRFSRFI